MCHRISPLLVSELQGALDELRTTGRARIPQRDAKTSVPDVYPGKQMPLFIANQYGELEVAELTWGFSTTFNASSKLVFNTRMDTALRQLASGHGLWANPIAHNRCLVPVRSFYESWTKSAERRHTDVRFSMPNRRVFLLAGLYEDDRFSVVTTTPNEDVRHYHTRMPLVLAPGESRIWLGPDFGTLAQRPSPRLDAEPEL